MADNQRITRIDYGPEDMWQLTNQGRTVRFMLPGMQVKGVREPIKVNIDFDAGVVDRMIDRLTILRAQMKPGPPPQSKRH